MKKWIEQPAEKSPMDPLTIVLDDAPPAVPSSSPGNSDPQQAAPALSGQSPAPNSDRILTGTFFHRFAQFYSQDWAGTNPAGPSETKRGLPPALDSPPFPFSDWGYGGAPEIGAPDGNTYPLMSALNLENSRTKSTDGSRAASISAPQPRIPSRSPTTFFPTRSNSIRRSYTSSASPTQCKPVISTGDTM